MTDYYSELKEIIDELKFNQPQILDLTIREELGVAKFPLVWIHP